MKHVHAFSGDVLGDHDADLARAVAILGEQYNYAELVGDALLLLLGRIGWYLRNPFRSKKAAVCAEFVSEVCQDAVAWRNLDPSVATPEQMQEACEQSPEFRKL